MTRGESSAEACFSIKADLQVEIASMWHRLGCLDKQDTPRIFILFSYYSVYLRISLFIDALSIFIIPVCNLCQLITSTVKVSQYVGVLAR